MSLLRQTMLAVIIHSSKVDHLYIGRLCGIWPCFDAVMSASKQGCVCVPPLRRRAAVCSQSYASSPVSRLRASAPTAALTSLPVSSVLWRHMQLWLCILAICREAELQACWACISPSLGACVVCVVWLFQLPRSLLPSPARQDPCGLLHAAYSSNPSWPKEYSFVQNVTQFIAYEQ